MMLKKIPNILTVARIIIIPIMILSFFIPGKIANIVAAGLFLSASITDYLDGYLARAMKVTSNFGKCLDPIADKLLVAVALIMLVHFSERNLWITIPGVVIICREILVSGLREYLASFNVSMPVTRLAKWKTGVQMTAITFLLLGEKSSEYSLMELVSYDNIGSMMSGLATHFGVVLLFVAAIMTIMTGYMYLKVGLKNM